MIQESCGQMNLINLASGSTGNCSYVETKNFKILIDLGKNKKYIVDKLAENNIDYHDIDYVFLTHAHDDHTSAIKTFLKKHKATLVLTSKMAKELGDLSNYKTLIYEDDPIIDGLNIKSFRMSHDAADTRAFLITEGNSSLVYITDTGYINTKYLNALKGKTAYFIESNHDIEMLTHGPYPAWLQKRVLSDVGHLSNKYTGMYLSKMVDDNTKDILLIHLSEKNNTEECAIKTVSESLGVEKLKNIKIMCAKPNEPSEKIMI